MNDVKNPDKLSAAIRLKFILDSSTFFNTRLKITNTNIRDEYIANKSVYDFHMTNSLLFNRKYKIIPVSNICGICCHLEIKKSNDRKKIISFFSELYGMTESTNQVIELLRSILVNNLSQREKLSADTRVKYICKAWNAYISNDTYKKLNVTKADKLLFL